MVILVLLGALFIFVTCLSMVGGALGALFAVAIIGSAEAGPRYPGVWFPWPAPMPPSYPARLREMRQKLVYRAP